VSAERGPGVPAEREVAAEAGSGVPATSGVPAEPEAPAQSAAPDPRDAAARAAGPEPDSEPTPEPEPERDPVAATKTGVAAGEPGPDPDREPAPNPESESGTTSTPEPGPRPEPRAEAHGPSKAHASEAQAGPEAPRGSGAVPGAEAAPGPESGAGTGAGDSGGVAVQDGELTVRDAVSAPGPDGRPRRVTRRFPLLTRDTARPEGGGRAAPSDAPAPVRQWPIIAVTGMVGLGLLLTALDAFKVGTLLIGLALLAGGALRWTLPDVGMLAVRSRFTDLVTYGVLGVAIALLAMMAQPNPWLEIPFLDDTLHFTIRT